MTGNGKGKGSGSKPKAKAAPSKPPASKPPAAKKQRAPKKKPPRAHAPAGNVFDAFNPSIPKSLLPIGQGLAVQGIAPDPLSLNTTDRALYFISNVGGTNTMGFRVNWSTAAVIGRVALSIPTLNAVPLSGGPTSVKPLSATIEVVNTSQVLEMTGSVFVLRLDQRLNFAAAPLSMSVANWDAIFTMITAHPKRRVDNGSHYANRRRYHCTVNDNAEYDTFAPHRGPLTSNDYFEHIAQWTASTPRPRPMTTYVVAFGSPAKAQTYTVTTAAQCMTRWPVDTITGQIMTDVPVGTHGEVVSQRKSAEKENGLGAF